MARSKQQQLDDVDAAIAAIERGAQSFQTALGSMVTRGDLKDLYAQRDSLQGEVALLGMGGDGPVGIQELGLGRVD